MTAEPTKILLGILSTYERSGWIHPDILKFVADLSLIPGYATRVVPLHNFVPAAAGRNVFCRSFKDADCDWICMMDNDMAPPANLFDTIKDAPKNAGIVVPAFFIWNGTNGELQLCWGTDKTPDKDGKTRSNFSPGFHELNKCGTGVIFIRPWVLKKISMPYFWYIYNSDQGMDGTEDIAFCSKVREAGIKIYGNTKVTVGHYHAVDLNLLSKVLDKARKEGLSFSHNAERPSAPAEASPADALIA